MFDLIRDEINQFEERLAAELQSSVRFIQAIADDLVAAGGKRLRPGLALIAARLLGADREIGLKVALTVEMLHSASLLHDDLIDGAATRRGRETAYRRYGNVISVVSGDFILARVLHILAQSNSSSFTQLVSEAAVRVCEGEVLQHEMVALGDYSLEGYRRVIEGKTAELIAAALEGVAVLADADEISRQALRDFGIRYGRAFQLQDDYLDLLGSEVELGKPIGGDLREGKVTYPVLLLLQRGVAEANEILQRRANCPGDEERMAQLARQYGTDRATRELIVAESEAAVRALAPLPEGEPKRILERLAQRELERAV